MKQWKLSPMDLEIAAALGGIHQGQGGDAGRAPTSRKRAGGSSKATARRKARLNCIHHLLLQVPYRDVEHQPIVLPAREHKPDYHRTPVPDALYVPAVY